tara:strand:+ start:4135 stop:4464 length:330 start_codon:yes stop_codon:yes gene_type:complete
MAVVPGMSTAAMQAGTMVEKSGKLPELTAAHEAKQQAALTKKAQLGAEVVGEVVGVVQAMREKKRKKRMDAEVQRRQQESLRIEGAGSDLDMLAANMPGHNPYAERPIS